MSEDVPDGASLPSEMDAAVPPGTDTSDGATSHPGLDASMLDDGGAAGEDAATDARPPVSDACVQGCQPPDPLPCGAVAHGAKESRLSYPSATVPYGGACVGQMQTRTCYDGGFGPWSGERIAASCVVLPAVPCDDVPHSGQQSRTRYLLSSVAFGGVCTPQVQARTCSNGTWGNWSGSYPFDDCVVQGALSCDGVPHGGIDTRVRFASAEAFAPADCLSEVHTRSCDNGNWSDWEGGAFANETCSQCADSDGDKHGPGCLLGSDCNEGEPLAFTGASEVDWNQIDENCDGNLGRHLRLRATYETDYLRNVQLDGDRVYAGVRRLRGLSRSDLSQVVSGPHLVTSLAIRHGRAATVDASGHLVVYDFGGPEGSLRELGRVHATAVTSQRPRWSNDGQRVYVAEGGSPSVFKLYGVPASGQPVLRDSISMTPCHLSVPIELLEDRGAALHVLCTSSSSQTDVFATFDLADLTNVTHRSTLFIPHVEYAVSRRQLAYDERTFYYGNTLRIDLSSPLAPQSSSSAQHIAEFDFTPVMGGLFAAWGAELCFYPGDGGAKTCIALPPRATTWRLHGRSGDTLVMGNDAELVAYDISVPTAPTPHSAAFRMLPDASWSVLKGDTVLSAYGLGYSQFGLLYAFDVSSDRPRPNLVAEVDHVSGTYGSLALHDDRLYVVGNKIGVLDVTSPAQPSLLVGGKWPSGGAYAWATSAKLYTNNVASRLLYECGVTQPDNISCSVLNPFNESLSSVQFGAFAEAGGKVFARYSNNQNEQGIVNVHTGARWLSKGSPVSDVPVGVGDQLLWTRHNAQALPHRYELVSTNASTGAVTSTVQLPGGAKSVAKVSERIFVTRGGNPPEAVFNTLQNAADGSPEPVFVPDDVTYLPSYTAFGAPGRLLVSGPSGFLVFEVVEP